ncbi:12 kDa heat shock protein [Termitomyces sp. J132]|nr:hypothetical protein H2248_003834 [Termitomyces sp. 'cryptogamus']KNZ79234.1 12 kDa heat shock protein [Termitomyces sp. J132]
MSDNNRQSFTDKASSALKPDSEKGTFEKASDSIKGNMDSLGSSVQPNSQKSTSQKIGDSVSGNSNQNDESLINKAKNAVGLGQNNNN